MSNKFSFNSVEEATLFLVDYFEVQNVIWDHMHETMKYDDSVINAMSTICDYVCKERNNLMSKDPKYSITLDEVFSE